MLTPPTVADLAEFTGRDPASFTAFADQALAQATLLFSITTGLDDYPTDPDEAQLAENAILEMADHIYLEQPYTASRAGPYTSETIGSYSYSKGSAAAKATLGGPTGLLWWDLAVDRLTVTDPTRAVVASSVIHVAGNGVLVGPNGERVIASPADLPPDDPLPLYYNPNTPVRGAP